MQKLYLIDGHALIFRMYYAFLKRPMINSKGEDTSILFGFTKYLLELIDREKPTHLAVAFDPPAKTFRHELDPEYKATRSATPELVKQALEPLVQIVEALRIPVLMKPGFEADDVIGTMARRFVSETMEVYMVTPDKDLGQIVDNGIFQYKPGKGSSDKEVLDRNAVCEHFGISDPRQVIDILAIWGDAADNVKGVRGVGEVGARKLVGRYGSVESIFEHLDELPSKQKEAFEESREQLKLSKELVTIRTDVPLEVSVEDLELCEADTEKISALIDHYEFKSLSGMIPHGSVVRTPDKKSLVCRETDRKSLAAKIRQSGRVAARILDKDRIILSCGNEYAIFPIAEAADILRDTAIAKVGHGLKETIVACLKAGIATEGTLLDTELMHYLLNPERTHKLEILAEHYLDIDLGSDPEADHNTEGQASVPEYDLFSAPSAPVTSGPDISRIARECVAADTMEPVIHRELGEQNMEKLYFEMEMPLVTVLAEMETAGIRIDASLLASYSHELGKEMAGIECEARRMAGEPELNLSSPKQLGILLYEKLRLNPKIKKNSKGSYPTDEETLSEMADAHPIIGKILEFRAIKKLISTYLDPLASLADPATGKVHTTFNQALTATGRLSSVKPNLQNIPVRTERGQKIREAFIPSTADGWIISADYSQIELRIMAHLSQDPYMLEGFAHGADVHKATAARIFHSGDQDAVTPTERRHAKVANFGIIYGISAFGLAQRMGIPRTEARRFIEEYFIKYPKVKEYMDKAMAGAGEKGFVQTIFGRKRYLPDINAKNPVVRSLAERNAINAPIQGSAADIIKLAMISVSRRIKDEKLSSRMVLQVHDELIFDVPDNERDRMMEIVKQEMEQVCSLSVPLTVECNYGKNWKEAH